KSVAASAFASCREVAYITLSSFRVNLFFRSFSPAIQLPEPPEPLAVSRCAVSVVAHYREFLTADKRLLQINERQPYFSTKRPFLLHIA
ncbi:hypothetical protein ACMGEE_19730, partial [Erwinia sp. DT-104]|uniref:hypothetical protein n=1 Tax=Erwinia sp. DT-104 TaxID=3396161 RepID=UPI003F1D39E2